jgi:Transposase IS66 family
MPDLHLCGLAAGGARRGLRPPPAGHPQCPGRGLSPRQAAHPPLVFDLLGLTISTGMIARLERQGAVELTAPVEELRQYVRDAASAHIDETSWWQGQDKAWLWGAVTKLVTVFTIANSRGAEVAKGMLGTAASKVVICDRFKSYTWVKRRQFCWAHTIRTQSTTRSVSWRLLGSIALPGIWPRGFLPTRA